MGTQVKGKKLHNNTLKKLGLVGLPFCQHSFPNRKAKKKSKGRRRTTASLVNSVCEIRGFYNWRAPTTTTSTSTCKSKRSIASTTSTINTHVLNPLLIGNKKLLERFTRKVRIQLQ